MTELTNTQKVVLRTLAESPLKNDFYWTGGTALSAVYLHHRLSEDIDLFSNTNFAGDTTREFVLLIGKKTNLEHIEEKKIHDRHEFFLKNGDDVRVEFVPYEYPALGPKKEWEGIRVDSLDDIAANKTMALMDRNEPKDAVDLYFLLKNGYRVDQLIAMVQKKFGVRIDEGTVLGEALKRSDAFGGIKPLLLPQDQQEETIQKIQKYFKEKSKAFLDGQFA